MHVSFFRVHCTSFLLWRGKRRGGTFISRRRKRRRPCASAWASLSSSRDDEGDESVRFRDRRVFGLLFFFRLRRLHRLHRLLLLARNRRIRARDIQPPLHPYFVSTENIHFRHFLSDTSGRFDGARPGASVLKSLGFCWLKERR